MRKVYCTFKCDRLGRGSSAQAFICKHVIALTRVESFGQHIQLDQRKNVSIMSLIKALIRNSLAVTLLTC